MKLDKEKILREIEGDKAFFVNDGNVIRSLKELPTAMQEMDNKTFMFHREHFPKWIKDVCGDKKLANDLMRVKTQATSAKKVLTRVNMLSK